jgi:hypothetical protein
VTAPVEVVPSCWLTAAFGSVVIGPGLVGFGLFEYSTCGAPVPASVASTTTDRSCCRADYVGRGCFALMVHPDHVRRGGKTFHYGLEGRKKRIVERRVDTDHLLIAGVESVPPDKARDVFLCGLVEHFTEGEEVALADRFGEFTHRVAELAGFWTAGLSVRICRSVSKSPVVSSPPSCGLPCRRKHVFCCNSRGHPRSSPAEPVICSTGVGSGLGIPVGRRQ